MGVGGEVARRREKRGGKGGKLERGGREKEENFARAMRKEEGESGKTKTAAKGDRGLSGKGGALL